MNQKCLLIVTLSLALSTAGRAAMPVSGEVANTNKPTIVVPPPTGGSTTSDPGTAKTAAPAPDILRFRNADLLHGSLVSASASDGVRWSHPQAKSQLAFGLEGLYEIQLGDVAKPRAGTRALVLLTNGDSLAGELTALTADTLTLQTWYAGAVTIKRNMIAGLRPNIGASTSLYSGPNNLAEWERPNRGNSGWQFRKGALIAAGGGGNAIGRDLKLPDMVNIECDLAWQGYPGFYMLFFVENFDDYYSSECYALQISGTSIYLQRARRGSGMNNVESNINVENLQRKGKAHFALKINKPKRTFALFLDDKLVKQWTDDNEFAGKGTGLGFVAQGQPTRISNITISEWDGRLDIDGGGKAAEEDFLRLANGDKLSGKLGTIANGQVALTTTFATMQIPLERVVEVLMGTKNIAKARRQTNDMYGFFADGSRVTLALEKLDGQQLTGSSENCGRLAAQRTAFQKLQFNIYEPKPEDEEDDWSTGGTKPVRGGRGGRMLID
jgi:hypothetical protein